MRRLGQPTINATSAIVLIGACVWAGSQLIDLGGFSSVPDRAVETLSTVGLSVEHVTVEGRTNTDPADILDALGAVRGTPILDIDIPLAQQRVAALPWVRSVEIVRRLPNSLHINLEEYVAFALWQRDNRYSLIAQDGTAITEVSEAPPGMVILVGADAPVHASGLFGALSTQPHLTARIKAAVRFGGRRWNVMLDTIESGITVKLPENGVSAAWDGLAAIDAEHDLLNRAVSEIDLRIIGRLVVKLRDGYAPLPPRTKNTPSTQDARWGAGAKIHKELIEGV